MPHDSNLEPTDGVADEGDVLERAACPNERRRNRKERVARAHRVYNRSCERRNCYGPIVPLIGDTTVATGGHDSRLGTAAGRALYRSANGGVSWSPLAMEFQQEYGIPIATHKDAPDVLFSVVAAGTPSTWRAKEQGADALLIRSADAGDSWHVLETGYPEIQRDFPGSIAMSPSDARNVFVATRRGHVYESKNSGDSWQDIGIHVPPVMAMTVTPA